jgi:hypothetical protein
MRKWTCLGLVTAAMVAAVLLVGWVEDAGAQPPPPTPSGVITMQKERYSWARCDTVPAAFKYISSMDLKHSDTGHSHTIYYEPDIWNLYGINTIKIVDMTSDNTGSLAANTWHNVSVSGTGGVDNADEIDEPIRTGSASDHDGYTSGPYIDEGEHVLGAFTFLYDRSWLVRRENGPTPCEQDEESEPDEDFADNSYPEFAMHYWRWNDNVWSTAYDVFDDTVDMFPSGGKREGVGGTVSLDYTVPELDSAYVQYHSPGLYRYRMRLVMGMRARDNIVYIVSTSTSYDLYTHNPP